MLRHNLSLNNGPPARSMYLAVASQCARMFPVSGFSFHFQFPFPLFPFPAFPYAPVSMDACKVIPY